MRRESTQVGMLRCWSVQTTVVSKSSYDSILDFFTERDIKILLRIVVQRSQKLEQPSGCSRIDLYR